MEFPRTPSPPPPPPATPPEVLEPMDLSSERPFPSGPCRGESPTDHEGYDDPQPSTEGFKQNHVSNVLLRGVPIVSLFIDGQERLCLAQISNTLLKNFSYNEIHNRRVALGITCVQCTPVQLEILRRAGAMPISSRRCGMITKREAERLVKSFLEEHAPPKLPDNFAFKVVHSCGWGSKGSFIPSRYNSSRAKCIKCTYCNLYFSPNKFIFHYHRTPDAKYRHPDAANFNSWRRHLELDYDGKSDDMMHAWEDVKAMFNGGSRKRIVSSSGRSISLGHREAEKRPRMSMERQNIPKLPHSNPNCSMFPQVNTVPNIFPPQTPYNNFPIMHNDMDSMNGDARRMCMPDLWRPKNTMPYYNPLGLMWAKNFGFCPPNQNSSAKPDAMRDAAMRMPNLLMDMNGNKPAMQKSPNSKAYNNKTGNSRNSAFRPVGNFMSSPTMCPAPEELLSSSRPPMSVTSTTDHSDDFSENLGDEDEDDDEEDIDIDVEDPKGPDSESSRDQYDDHLVNMSLTSDLEPGNDGVVRNKDVSQFAGDSGAVTATSQKPKVNSPCSTKSDRVATFTIDRLFHNQGHEFEKSVPDPPLWTQTERAPDCHPGTDPVTVSLGACPSPPAHPLNTPDNGNDVAQKTTSETVPGDTNSPPLGGATDANPSQDLGYILQLSKEQLQSELLKMLGVKQKQVSLSENTMV